jgi:hypothetical protein
MTIKLNQLNDEVQALLGRFDGMTPKWKEAFLKAYPQDPANWTEDEIRQRMIFIDMAMRGS